MYGARLNTHLPKGYFLVYRLIPVAFEFNEVSVRHSLKLVGTPQFCNKHLTVVNC
jgi:hypothetical protein